MLCRNCKREIDSESYLCPYCSYQVQTMDGQVISEDKKTSDKKMILLLLALVLALLSFVLYITLSNPEEKFIKYVLSDRYEKASTIYENRIRTNDNKRVFVIKELDEILLDKILKYNQEEISYQDALSVINLIDRLSINKKNSEESLSKLEELKTSKDAYLKAQENIQNEFFIDAMLNINDIIREDEKFESGQKLLQEIEKDVYNQLVEYAKELEADNDFDSISTLILTIISNYSSSEELKIIQANYIEKENVFLHGVLEEEKLALIKLQKVLVQSAEIVIQKDYIDLYYIKAKVRNDSEKMLVAYDIALLAFDKDGKPIKLSDDYLKIGRVNDIKLNKDEVYGDDAGWNIMDLDEENIVFIKACITKAQFVDGEEWENGYYEHWINQYLGKNLDI